MKQILKATKLIRLEVSSEFVSACTGSNSKSATSPSENSSIGTNHKTTSKVHDNGSRFRILETQLTEKHQEDHQLPSKLTGGNAVPKPIMQENQSLPWKRVVSILQNSDQYDISKLPAVKPKGGEIYLIKAENSKCVNDWRCDQYQWRVHNGTSTYPRRSDQVVVKQISHKVSKKGSFRRSASILLEKPDLVLVHYLGDESEHIGKSHGSSKSANGAEHIRVMPSVMSGIKWYKRRPFYFQSIVCL